MSLSGADLTALASQIGALAQRLGASGPPAARTAAASSPRAGQGAESSTGASSPAPAAPAGLAAVQIASELSAASAVALRLSVDLARAAGRTWQELGDVLGVSRQAAFQRFGHPLDPRTGQPMSNGMLPAAAAKATTQVLEPDAL